LAAAAEKAYILPSAQWLADVTAHDLARLDIHGKAALPLTR
jgi:hypothetical protein